MKKILMWMARLTSCRIVYCVMFNTLFDMYNDSHITYGTT